jgi:hypothetical protein
MNKRAQESGSFQKVIVALLCISAVTVLAINYLNDLGENYDVDFDDSEYQVFNKFDDVNTTLGSMTDQLSNEGGEQLSDFDVITFMVTGGYSLIQLMMNIPGIFFDLVVAGVVALGLPSAMVGFVMSLIIVLILFAALALIMKVRA